MEDFERIKELTAEAVKTNVKNTTIMRKWKQEVRQCLMRVRERFNDQIDKFVYQFSTIFKDVEMSNDLKEFKGEDKRLLSQVEELQKKYCEILRIFNNISTSSAQKRIQYIDNIKTYMKNVEKKVKEQDQVIKTRSRQLREAIDKIVSVDGFEQKME